MMNSFCPLAREKYTHFAVASFFSLFFFAKSKKMKEVFEENFLLSTF